MYALPGFRLGFIYLCYKKNIFYLWKFFFLGFSVALKLYRMHRYTRINISLVKKKSILTRKVNKCDFLREQFKGFFKFLKNFSTIN